MLKKAFIFFSIIAFHFPIILHAQQKPIDRLTQYLNKHYPPVYQIISQISEKHQKRLVFSKEDTSVSRGQELLVLEQKTDVPDYLLPQSAVIRIESMFKDKVLAQKMAQIGEPVQKGDPVAQPASPVIYFYTNIKNKDTFPPYKKLLQALLDEDYEVVEVFKDQIKQRTDRYGVLVRLEYTENHLISKIQSLYSGDTFFSKSWKYLEKVTILSTAGKPVNLIKPSPPAAEAKRAKKGKPSFMQAEEKGKGELAYNLSESFTKTPSFMKAQPSPERKVFRLRKGYKRFTVCNLNNDGKVDFVFLSNKRIDAYTFDGSTLSPLDSYSFNKDSIIGIHLHSIDLTHNTKDEIIATLGHEGRYAGAPDTEIQSQILSYKNGHFQTMAKNLPYYLRVIDDWEGRPVLLGQKKGKYTPYKGDIARITWNKNTNDFAVENPYQPAKDIYSVYQFNFVAGQKNYVMILEPSNFVSVYYAPEERMQAITDRNYGQFRAIPYKIKLEEPEYMGDYEHKKLFQFFYAPRRFVMELKYDGQAFLINKERANPSLVQKIKETIIKEKGEDSLSALKWAGDYIRQTWQSKKLPKNILDFQFYSSKDKDHIFALIRDNQGYALERMQ